MKCACRDCKIRKIGCHATCESYLKFKKELEIMNNKIRDEKFLDNRPFITTARYRDQNIRYSARGKISTYI